jgi:hypothetical protein
MLFTVLERTGNKGKGAEIWEKRFSEFNKGVRAVGAEVGAIVVDANQEKFFSDRRFLAFDRLHLNAEGHKRCADAVLERLDLPFDPGWRTPLPPKAIPWAMPACFAPSSCIPTSGSCNASTGWPNATAIS